MLGKSNKIQYYAKYVNILSGVVEILTYKSKFYLLNQLPKLCFLLFSTKQLKKQ